MTRRSWLPDHYRIGDQPRTLRDRLNPYCSRIAYIAWHVVGVAMIAAGLVLAVAAWLSDNTSVWGAIAITILIPPTFAFAGLVTIGITRWADDDVEAAMRRHPAGKGKS
jgi:ABC-type multidrug transport system permease subunit